MITEEKAAALLRMNEILERLDSVRKERAEFLADARKREQDLKAELAELRGEIRAGSFQMMLGL